MKKLVIVVGTIFASLLVFGVNCYAQKIYGCQQRNDGQLRIVSNPGACRPSETPISWNLTGPAGPPGPVGPQGAQGPAGPAGPQAAAQAGPGVYDAKGNLLGMLAGILDGYISVFIPTLSRFISISPVTGDVDPYFSWGQIYYSDSLCSSQPYLDLSMRYEIFKLDSNYLMADDNATVECIGFNYYNRTDYTKCSPRSPVCVRALPAKKVTFPFDMPVPLPLQIR